MTDTFEIPVLYKGEEMIFMGRLVKFGYIHKIEIDLHGQLIMLEPDEEQNYRATVDAAFLHDYANMDKALLQEIIAVIGSVTG